MQKFITLLLLCALNTEAWAQQAQKVWPITRESHPVSWYQEQSRLWRQILDRDAQNPAAWHSYYEANRALRNLQGEHEPLDDIVKEMGDAVPGSYEFHYLSYRNGSFGATQQSQRFPHLEKAHRIDPRRTEVLENFVTHYEVTWDLPKRKEFNIKRYQANDIPQELLFYNYNVLMSLAPNAILFTNGDNDTYPLWLLQDALGIRTDVMVLNCSLIFLEEYLNQLLQSEQLPEFHHEINSQEDWAAYHPALRDHLLVYSNRPLYYAATVNPATYEKIKDKLYLVGLASRYSEVRVDNEKRLVENIEKKFLMDYLRVNVSYHPAQSPIGHLHQAYLTPFLALHRYYQRSGMEAKANETKNLIMKIARHGGREAEVAKAFE
jgi:hypothetical protein